jgi:dTDP-4-dehydrorhamnose reductase
VFAGTLPLGRAYTEQDTPDARDMYGLTKYLGEVSSPSAVTLRTSIIGWELERPSGLLEWLVGQRGKRVQGYTHAIFSGLTTRALARVIVALSENYVELRGLYHVSSDPISKYDLLDELRDRLELAVELIPTELPVINRALDSQRFSRATGLAMPSWAEMLSEYTKGVVPANDPR